MSMHRHSMILGFTIDETLEFAIEIHGDDEIYVSMKHSGTGVKLSTIVEEYDLPELLKVVQAAIITKERI